MKESQNTEVLRKLKPLDNKYCPNPVDMKFELIKRTCPLCGSENREKLFEISAKTFCDINPTYSRQYTEILDIDENMSFPIVSCSECDFIYAEQLLSPQGLGLVYEQIIDPQLGLSYAARPSWVGHQLKMAGMLLRELSLVFPDTEKLKILDFGCGQGTILKAMNGLHIKCIGFETSEREVNHLNSLGLPTVKSLDEIRAAKPFHAVILSDVLEHIPEPREILSLCHDVLIQKGLVCINVPEFSKTRMSKIKKQLDAGQNITTELNPWEHLNYFSPETLREMLNKEKFQVVEPFMPDYAHPNAAVKYAKKLFQTVRFQMNYRTAKTFVYGQKNLS